MGLIFSSTFTMAQAQIYPEISAQAWLVADESGKIIMGENTKEVRSIASITKLMTSMVVLDSNQDLNEVIPKKLYGQHLTRRQLLTLAIVKSDNTAAHMLCEYYINGYKACIEAMNDKARSLEMYDTSFTDATGLMYTNQSTAEDLIKMLKAASEYEVIREDSNKGLVVWHFGKKKVISFRNTNPIVNDHTFMVSKTGYISRSGGCIAMMANTSNGPMAFIILGSKTVRTRIPEARIILATYN